MPTIWELHRDGDCWPDTCEICQYEEQCEKGDE